MAVAAPGATVGAAIAAGVWAATRPAPFMRWMTSVLGVATLAVFHSALAVLWPWRLLLPHLFSGLGPPPDLAAVFHSVAVEALAGPLLLTLVIAARDLRRQTIVGEIEHDVRSETALANALYASGVQRLPDASARAHPAGRIRLGSYLRNANRPFDLDPAELKQHALVIGASGSGKTTTLSRLADGALANGYSLVLIDCKGHELRGVARQLSDRYGLPLTMVDPGNPESYGYNPCSGDGTDVANKLLGAFSFEGAAEIYKLVAAECLPVLAEALVAAGRPLTVSALADALWPDAMRELARDTSDRYRDKLLQFAKATGVTAEGYAGFRARLGALSQGKFGKIFEKSPAVDWDAQFAEQTVMYFGLSVTGAGQDVELMARIIAEDLKQVCDRRLGAIEAGESPRPVFIEVDEFASLKDPDQFVNLLLQARGAGMPVLLSTQFLPEDRDIKQASLQAGVIVAHSLESEDANVVAAQFGTKTVPKLTLHVNWETGDAPDGTTRDVEEYVIHPEKMRSAGVGVAAVRVRPTPMTKGRRELVRVYPPTEE
ncbi:MAG: type IV secretory system conjugative DNA transfer family protein [Acidimicrobiales bacterium]